MYGQRNPQDHYDRCPSDIPAQLKKSSSTLPALVGIHHTTAEGKEISFLEHHLMRYTRRNTSDFFVHKDLRGFLYRELDFYLKNEVLSLDELEAAGESAGRKLVSDYAYYQRHRRSCYRIPCANRGFPEKLFEKKKFILNTQYCILMAIIPAEFYVEMAKL